jgi:hypothetical protein
MTILGGSSLFPTNRVSRDGHPPGTNGPASAFAIAGGEMAALIHATDWVATDIGPPETWPQSLMTILRIMVTSRYQMWMAWGRDLTFFVTTPIPRP